MRLVFWTSESRGEPTHIGGDFIGSFTIGHGPKTEFTPEGIPFLIPEVGGYFGNNNPEKREVLMPIGFRILGAGCGMGALYGWYDDDYLHPIKVGAASLKFLDYEGEIDVYQMHDPVEGWYVPEWAFSSATIEASEYWSHGGKYNTETGERI